MEPADVYAWLMKAGGSNSCSAFDAHVLASTLALATVESEGDGRKLVGATGLEPAVLLRLIRDKFPHAAEPFERTMTEDATLEFKEDELCLRDLLMRGTSEDSEFERLLAMIVARRCQRPNHLWQDLGLRNRRELSWLMERHFEPLSRKNKQDMKWKKFLYRVICRDEGYSICTAPSCSECADFSNCYGEENGESLMARGRRDDELAAKEAQRAAELAAGVQGAGAP